MATRRMNSQSVLFLNHEIQELLFKNEDNRYLYQFTKFAKNDLKTPKITKFMHFFLGCVIFVAMATRRMNGDKRYLYQATKVAKIDLKRPKIAQLCIFFFGCVIFVAIATRRMNLQSIVFLNHDTQGFLFMNDDKGCLYQSTKLA